MSIIDEFMKKALTGNWVSTKTCEVNDILKITSPPTMDSETYPGKTYLIMDVTHERTNNQMKLRLSGQQVQSLAPTFSNDASKWVTRRIRIVAKQNYPGLGKEGFIYIPA